MPRLGAVWSLEALRPGGGAESGVWTVLCGELRGEVLRCICMALAIGVECGKSLTCKKSAPRMVGYAAHFRRARCTKYRYSAQEE